MSTSLFTKPPNLAVRFSLAADINSNMSDVGIGHVTHNIRDMRFLDYSSCLGVDCYGWGVPLGAGRQAPAWTKFTTEFSSLTWVLIFSALLLAAAVLWILSRALPQPEVQDKALYHTLRWAVHVIQSVRKALTVRGSQDSDRVIS
jgi:hypothetical protein